MLLVSLLVPLMLFGRTIHERTVHAATIKDSRPGHAFPFFVLVSFRKGGLLDWVDMFFLGHRSF